MNKNPLNIVLIDDSADFRLLFERSIEDFDLNINLKKACGFASLSNLMMEGARPDVAIVDYYLPDSNGCDVAEYIKGHCPKCYVVAVSSCIDDKFVKCKYVDKFYPKPLSKGQIMHILECFK